MHSQACTYLLHCSICMQKNACVPEALHWVEASGSHRLFPLLGGKRMPSGRPHHGWIYHNRYGSSRPQIGITSLLDQGECPEDIRQESIWWQLCWRCMDGNILAIRSCHSYWTETPSLSPHWFEGESRAIQWEWWCVPGGPWGDSCLPKHSSSRGRRILGSLTSSCPGLLRNMYQLSGQDSLDGINIREHQLTIVPAYSPSIPSLSQPAVLPSSHYTIVLLSHMFLLTATALTTSFQHLWASCLEEMLRHDGSEGMPA